MTLFSYSRDYRMLMDVLLRDSERYSPIMQFAETVMRKTSELTPEQRELIAAYVSALNECQFCVGAHEAVAEAYGVDEAVLKSLRDDPDGPNVDDNMKPIMELVRKLTETPARVVQSDIAAVVHAGWSEQTAEDVIAITSLFAFFNRMADGFGIPASAEVFGMLGPDVAPAIYEPMFNSAVEAKAKKA